MRKLTAKWGLERKGIRIGSSPDDILQNLRFADDLLLVGVSLDQASKMLEDLMTEAALCGLVVHMGKTKILCNCIGPKTKTREIMISGECVQILSGSDVTSYLGRALNLRSTHEAEVDHRISRAWAKFAVFRQELLDKHYSLNNRLRLFNSVVTPTVLYGCGSWVMTVGRERQLRTCQRKMLRSILGKGRAILNKQGDETSQLSLDQT
eukprot:9967939-Karenia_brevis.AAC.1